MTFPPDDSDPSESAVDTQEKVTASAGDKTVAGTDAGTGSPGRRTGSPGPVTAASADAVDAANKDDKAGAAADPLTTVTRERDEYLDMVRRVQADFENYKKRMLRQQTDQLERASENLVVKLLPALDAFDLTRAHLGEEDVASAEVKALFQASALVDDVLTKEGLERIDEAGAPFDPTVHDAVEHAPAADEPAPASAAGSAASGATVTGPTGAAAPKAPASTPTGPVVVEVLRPGYRWKGRVIRPAMVRVRG